MTDYTPPSRDDLADRIMDLALREKAGGKGPPDLAAQILARADAQVSLRESRRGALASPKYGSYLPLAVSACMLALALLCAVLMQPEAAVKLADLRDGDLLRAYERNLADNSMPHEFKELIDSVQKNVAGVTWDEASSIDKQYLSQYLDGNDLNETVVKKWPAQSRAVVLLRDSSSSSGLSVTYSVNGRTHTKYVPKTVRVAGIEQVRSELRKERAARRQSLAALQTRLSERRDKLVADVSKYKKQLDARGIYLGDGPIGESTVWSVDAAKRGSAETKIVSALSDPTVIEFEKTPLKDAVDYLKDLHGIEIQIDENALKSAGIVSEKPITYIVKGESLRSSLVHLLDGLGLTYQIKNEVLQITTPKAAGYLTSKLNGQITAVAGSGKLVEISLGSDDGLQAGRVVQAYREDGTAIVGGLKVLRITPDRAVAEVMLATAGPLRKGNHVSAMVFDLPREPEIIPEPREPEEPDLSGDKFDLLPENDFEKAKASPQSTISIDVDTASYSKVRQFLMQANQLPPGEAVRLEELINYFPYDYAPPQDDKPFAAHVETAACPWNGAHRLVRIGLKGRVVEAAQRPACNLVFLVDVSGSMNEANKLPLVTNALRMLAGELTERDRVSIVVYAGAAGMVLPPTRGDARPTIYTALSQLQAGGSTNGGEGIELAYKTCQENFLEGGVNRVILCTDGDFNVGLTSTGQLVDLAKEKAQKGVFLSVLGFGMGNHNDEMLEAVSNKANGNHAFIDSLNEARKVLVREISGTLVTIAKDVKIQVDFDPTQVESYRLLGYENRLLAAEDFEDDQKDAGEIGGGHTVTALYEVVPTPARPAGAEESRKTRSVSEDKKAKPAGKLLTLKLRYKQPDGDKSALLEFPVTDSGHRFGEASADFQFAAAVASFGMILRKSKHAGDATLASVAETAAAAKGPDPHGYRAEFVELVKKARELSH